MAFKFVVSHGGKSYQTEKDAPLAGKKIGDVFEGSLIGLPGYKLAITGGSDKSGFPMRNDIEGQARKKEEIQDRGHEKKKKPERQHDKRGSRPDKLQGRAGRRQGS